MRYSIPIKFIAIFLTSVALLTAFVCCLGIFQVVELGLYTDGFDSWVSNRLEWQAYGLAEDLTTRYGVRALTNCPDDVLEELGYWYIFDESIHWTGFDEDSYDFSITAPDSTTLAAGEALSLSPKGSEQGFTYQTVCSVQYPVLVTDEDMINELYGTKYLRRQTLQLAAFDNKSATVRYYESPDYTVTVTLDTDAFLDRSGTSLELVQLVYAQRYRLMLILPLALILLAAGAVYLCCAAGKKSPAAPAAPGGLNRLPLDLYAAAVGGSGFLLGALAVQMIEHWILAMDNLNPGTLSLVGLVLLAIAVLAVGFLYALVAQFKVPHAFWWKNCLLGRLFTFLGKGLGFVTRRLAGMLKLLPLMWRYILIAAAMALIPGMFAFLAVVNHGHFARQFWLLLLIISLLADMAVVLYGAYAYGTLLRGAERMAQGNLASKISTRYLFGFFARCAEHLNALADVATVAAKKQMQSERMKTELITNVSHDIKTPLTSIINYVDLLPSARDEAEARQYLEVLARQSQRLKKLIEDLMEMSKASSGSMAVEIVPTDPVEAVNQALGEFSDKLSAARLTPIFRQPEQPLSMLADGRLTWRVLSNLLSNTVKYALPGTRFYVDVLAVEDRVLICLKNISQEPLNISAEELTERFVRGDASRQTEGSGLGLNIAKSLMELQKGDLQLLIDGDLFKVTLTFPAAPDFPNM